LNEFSTGRSGFPPAYLGRVGSSFTDFLASAAPDLLPGRRPLPPGLLLDG
jgi:proteasome beta subunit